MIPKHIRIKDQSLPDTPGVYLMKDDHGTILYVGKATSLIRRVNQHFSRPHNRLIEEMTSLVHFIDYIPTPSALEALILEANLIKQYWPKYNTDQKDDKSFLYLVITKDEYPRPVLVRGKDLQDAQAYKAVFGPYTSAGMLRAALDEIRKAIPWSTCSPGQKRPCFYVHLKQCPGVCAGLITPRQYGKIIRQLMVFFQGKKDRLVKQLTHEMKVASKAQDFERAADLRNRVSALQHIRDVAILKREDEDQKGRSLDGVDGEVREDNLKLFYGRIEGYDISHISGTSQVASMVVFERGAPAKGEYRKFHIRGVEGANDVASIQEVLRRRLTHREWLKPDLILIDGGAPQVAAATEVLRAARLSIPLIGLAKGAARKRNDLVVLPGQEMLLSLCRAHLDVLIRVRDEAHRFAITFHRRTRRRRFLQM